MSRILISQTFRGIAFILQAVLFRIVPTAFEISMVCGILVSSIFHDKYLFTLTVSRDVQIWLGFCCHNFNNLGGIHVVYCPDDFMEVRSLGVQSTLSHTVVGHIFVEMQTRQITELPLSAWIL